ncbi:hypothetical protein PG987_010657 [Apiospora arundinis]
MDTDHDEEIPLSPTGVPSEDRKTKAPRSHNWAPEIAALICSAAALIALIVLLLKEDAKPLDEWKAPFSLNTVAAILSVAFKTPLAFVVGSCLGQGKWLWFSKRSGPVAVFAAIEEASRGPLGSLQLLWRLKARHWVSFGALVTVALVGVDPFLQAIINHEGQLAPGASANRTNDAFYIMAAGLNTGSPGVVIDGPIVPLYHNVGGIVHCREKAKADLGMSASSILGFLNTSASNEARPPSVTCKTGNCTWEACSTLAFCSSCFDVSSHIKKHPVQGQPSCYSDKVTRADFDANSTFTNYTILYGSDDVSYWGLDGKTRLATLFDKTFCGKPKVTGKTLVDPRRTYNLQEWDTLLAAFVLLRPADSYFSGEKLWEDDAMTATECGIRLCTRVFQPKVTNGGITEKPISEEFERVPESFQPTERYNVPVNHTVGKWINDDFGNSLDSRVSNNSCFIDRTPLQLRIPGEVQIPFRVFNITQDSITTIIDELVSDGSQRIFEVLSKSTNLTTSFENAARFMSYHIRDRGRNGIPGVTQKWTIYTQIRWQFMIFPIVTSVFGSVFSVIVMLGSGKGKTRIMKANMLESMLHGLDEETSTQLRNSNVKEKMEKHVYVRLRDGPEGLRLRTPGGDPNHSSGDPPVSQLGPSNPSSDQSLHMPG